MYWLGGVIELPPEDRDDRSLPEKLRGLLVALKHGDVVMIFPEGEIHSREPPVGKFAPGVVYVYRRLGAPIVPIAVWMSERRWPRRRYVVQPLEYSSGGRIMIRKLKSGKYRLYSRKKDPKTVARYFLSLDQLFKQLQLDPDLDEEKARALVEQVASKDYSPPSREKVLEFQAHQQFPICPNPEDPDACNVYKDLRFPPEVYESINEYYMEKSGAEG
jgi:1-acyl-sn-glycerol-3-phosphate acyltransferase